MAKQFATIKDVARAAGVSVATVSAVVSGRKPVSERLAERVRHAIRELDYHPNQLARGLSAQATRTIAFITPDVGNPVFLNTFRSAEAVARDRGYSLLLMNTNGDSELTRHAIDQALGLRVEGVLITVVWSVASQAGTITRLLDRGVAVVGVGGSYQLDQIDCFLHDDTAAGRELGVYLRRIGTRRLRA